MRKTLAIAALGLSACATTPAMENALAPLTGQSIETVVAQLGPPSSSGTVGADTVYDWHQGKSVSGAPARGNLIGPVTAGENTMTSGLYAGPPVPYTCDVRIVTDADGRIKDARFSEHTGGCRETARMLRQLALSDDR